MSNITLEYVIDYIDGILTEAENKDKDNEKIMKKLTRLYKLDAGIKLGLPVSFLSSVLDLIAAGKMEAALDKMNDKIEDLKEELDSLERKNADPNKIRKLKLQISFLTLKQNTMSNSQYDLVKNSVDSGIKGLKTGKAIAKSKLVKIGPNQHALQLQ